MHDTQHRATPEQWGDVYDDHDSNISGATCILELRDRLAAVEQRLAALEGNSSAGLTGSAPAGSLVEVVGMAICTVADCGDTPLNWAPEARAAILAVAAWLDTKGQHGCSLWLREEVERHG